MDNQNIENAEELNDDIATDANTESPDQEPVEESEELEETEHTDEDEEADEPDLTPGVKKRIAKLAQKHEREKAELQAKYETELFQIQQNIASQQQMAQTSNDAQMQQQYQQIYGQQSQPNQFGYVDPNQPQQPTFEQFKSAVAQAQTQAKAEEQRAAHEAEFSQGLKAVSQKSLARSLQDSEYKTLLGTHINLLTPQMVYGLKGLKNPDSFIKHLLKKDTDRAALRQLQLKNPLEQATTMAHWGAQFESQTVRTNATAPKAKPISQPKGSGSINARVKVGIDPNNPATHTPENIRAFMRGR